MIGDLPSTIEAVGRGALLIGFILMATKIIVPEETQLRYREIVHGWIYRKLFWWVPSITRRRREF